MTTDDKTLDINPDKLSNDVIQSLREEDGISKQKAQEIGDNVWLEEIEPEQATKTTIRDQFESIVARQKSRLSSVFSSVIKNRTVFAEVTDVSRTRDDTVQIRAIHNQHGIVEIELAPESRELSNLLCWAHIEDPTELRDTYIPVIKYISDKESVLIPNNVSISGQMRFWLYILTKELNKRTQIKTISKYADSIVMSSFTMGVISILIGVLSIPLWHFGLTSAVIGIITPVLLFATFLASTVAYLVFRLMFLIILHILRGEFIQAK